MRKQKPIHKPITHTPQKPLEPIVTPASEEFKLALYAELQRMIQARRDALRIPDHVLYGELMRHISSALNDLYKDGLIKVGPTINDKYITTETE